MGDTKDKNFESDNEHALPLVSKMLPKTVLLSPFNSFAGVGVGGSALTDTTGSYIWDVKSLFVR